MIDARGSLVTASSEIRIRHGGRCHTNTAGVSSASRDPGHWTCSQVGGSPLRLAHRWTWAVYLNSVGALDPLSGDGRRV